MTVRKYTACVECGETREIAAHGLCFACYRQNVRDHQRPRTLTQHQLVRSYFRISQSMNDARVSDDERIVRLATHRELDRLEDELRRARELRDKQGHKETEV